MASSGPSRQRAWVERTKKIMVTRGLSKDAAAFVSRPIGEKNTIEGLFKGFSWSNIIIVVMLFIFTVCVVLVPTHELTNSVVAMGIGSIHLGFYTITDLHQETGTGFFSPNSVHISTIGIILLILNFAWVLIVAIECWFTWRFRIRLGRRWVRAVTVILLLGAILFTLTGLSAVPTDIAYTNAFKTLPDGGTLTILPNTFLFHVKPAMNGSETPYYVLASNGWLFIMIACLFVAMGLYVMLDQKTIDRIHHILGTKPYDLPDK